MGVSPSPPCVCVTVGVLVALACMVLGRVHVARRRNRALIRRAAHRPSPRPYPDYQVGRLDRPRLNLICCPTCR